MRNVECCDKCNKFTMVGIDNGSALLFAHQWCKCSEERENVMSDNIRDTQFQVFAECLMEEIDQINSRTVQSTEDEKEICQLIARRAYDLVKHAFKEARSSVGDADYYNVPDMNELPKESS